MATPDPKSIPASGWSCNPCTLIASCLKTVFCCGNSSSRISKGTTKFHIENRAILAGIDKRREQLDQIASTMKALAKSEKQLTEEIIILEGLVDQKPDVQKTHELFLAKIQPIMDEEANRLAQEEQRKRVQEQAQAQRLQDALVEYNARHGPDASGVFPTGLHQRAPQALAFGSPDPLSLITHASTAPSSPAAAAAREIEATFEAIRCPSGNLEDARWRSPVTLADGTRITYGEQRFFQLLGQYPAGQRQAIMAALSPAMKKKLPNLQG